jgi:glycerol-3-phosphate dehydrogenase
MRAAKGGPQALFELPPREGFSPNDQGHFSGLSAGSQIITGTSQRSRNASCGNGCRHSQQPEHATTDAELYGIRNRK